MFNFEKTRLTSMHILFFLSHFYTQKITIYQRNAKNANTATISTVNVHFITNFFSLYTRNKMCVGGAIMDLLCPVCPSVRPSVGLHYLVRSINPIPIEGLSSNLAEMFTSTSGCTEPMLPMCQLKVKVTIEGQKSNNQILDIMSCPLCKSYTK